MVKLDKSIASLNNDLFVTQKDDLDIKVLNS